MSEWDFLWDLSGQALDDAMTSGADDWDWYLVGCEEERLERKRKWEALKAKRDNGEISCDEFKRQKELIFGSAD